MTMSDNVRFILIRHGQTRENLLHILQGQMDTELDETGIAQAHTTAEAIRNLPIDIAFSSDLKRAMLTTQIALANRPEIKIIPTKALREWCLGRFQGMTWDQIRQENPIIPKLFTEESRTISEYGVETKQDLQQRVSDFFWKTAQEHPGKNILICTHGGVMLRIFRLVTGSIDPNNKVTVPDNASISKIEYLADRKGWQLVEWNTRPYNTAPADPGL